MALTTVMLASRKVVANVLSAIGSAYMALIVLAILLKSVAGDLHFPWSVHLGTAIAVGLLLLSGAFAQNMRAVTIPAVCWLVLGLLVQPITGLLSYAFDNEQWVLVVVVLGAAGFAGSRGVRFVSPSEVDP
jgi:hypothetical protein